MKITEVIPNFFTFTPLSSLCGLMKSTAKTGLMMYATINEAVNVMINVMGRYPMNFPITPSQNARGTNGASVVAVPDKTGRKISPAAFFAAILIGTFPLS